MAVGAMRLNRRPGGSIQRGGVPKSLAGADVGSRRGRRLPRTWILFHKTGRGDELASASVQNVEGEHPEAADVAVRAVELESDRIGSRGHYVGGYRHGHLQGVE